MQAHAHLEALIVRPSPISPPLSIVSSVQQMKEQNLRIPPGQASLISLLS